MILTLGPLCFSLLVISSLVFSAEQLNCRKEQQLPVIAVLMPTHVLYLLLRLIGYTQHSQALSGARAACLRFTDCWRVTPLSLLSSLLPHLSSTVVKMKV